jgi:hypothetical protein
LRNQEQGRGCASEPESSPDQKIATCTKVLDSTGSDAPTRSHVLADRGDAYRANGRGNLAIKEYDAAIVINPRTFAGRGLAERDADHPANGRAEIGKLYLSLHYWDMIDEALAGDRPTGRGRRR